MEKAPSTNLQAPDKLQISNTKKTAARVWMLAFEISLELGAWNLDV
jgi:hypothetical protein